MIDHDEVRLACRARLLTLGVCDSGDPNGSFARASEASYVDADGVVQFAAVDEPRTAHYVGGSPTYLFEATPATNLVLDSTDWRAASWDQQPLEVPAITSPIAGASSYSLSGSGGGGYAGFARAALPDLAAGTYVFSAYVRAAATDATPQLQLRTNGLTLLFLARWSVDGSLVPVVSTGTGHLASVPLGNDWHRISAQWTVTEETAPFLDISFNSGSNGRGHGAGAQVELGSGAASSFIRSTGTATTRAADTGELLELEATATGYTRNVGSFLTDGFAVGMEVTPTGFTQTATGVITGVTATTLTISGGRDVEAAASGRSLAVALPSARGWENVRFEPTAGRPFVSETYLPGAMTKRGLGAQGFLEATPLYVLNVGVERDTDTTALYRTADAILEHFAPTTPLTLANGDVAVVRSDLAPTVSGLRTTESHAVTTVTIPLRLTTANSR